MPGLAKRAWHHWCLWGRRFCSCSCLAMGSGQTVYIRALLFPPCALYFIPIPWDTMLQVNIALSEHVGWSGVLIFSTINLWNASSGMHLVRHHDNRRQCVNSTTRDMWCDLKLVWEKEACTYRCQLLSELEIEGLENICFSDIGKKSISGIPK